MHQGHQGSAIVTGILDEIGPICRAVEKEEGGRNRRTRTVSSIFIKIGFDHLDLHPPVGVWHRLEHPFAMLPHAVVLRISLERAVGEIEVLFEMRLNELRRSSFASSACQCHHHSTVPNQHAQCGEDAVQEDSPTIIPTSLKFWIQQKDGGCEV